MRLIAKLIFKIIKQVFSKNLPIRALLALKYVCLTSTLAATEPLTYELLKKELSGFKKNELTKGQFEQTKTISELKIDIVSSGKYEITRFKEGDIKVIWDIRKPEAMEVCLNKDIIKIRKNKTAHKKNDDISVSTEELASSQATSFKSMLSLMRLDIDEIDNLFNVFKDKNYIIFTPKKPENFLFEKASVSIDKDSLIQETNIFEKGGDLLNIKFLKSKKSKLISNKKKDC